jgi:hypothetical protein
LHAKQLTAAIQVTTKWIIITIVRPATFAAIYLISALIGRSLILFGPLACYCANLIVRLSANYPELLVATNASA